MEEEDIHKYKLPETKLSSGDNVGIYKYKSNKVIQPTSKPDTH